MSTSNDIELESPSALPRIARRIHARDAPEIRTASPGRTSRFLLGSTLSLLGVLTTILTGIGSHAAIYCVALLSVLSLLTLLFLRGPVDRARHARGRSTPTPFSGRPRAARSLGPPTRHTPYPSGRRAGVAVGALSKRSVFISYPGDDEELIRQVASRLRRRGITARWDGELIPGQDFASTISEWIQGSFTVAVIVTEATATSTWIPREVSLAIELERRLVPVVVGNAVIPPKLRLPLAGVNQTHVDRSASQIAFVVSEAVLRHAQDAAEISRSSMVGPGGGGVAPSSARWTAS